jgi:transketolase
MKPDFNTMTTECRELRRAVIDAAYGARSGHCGGSLSAAEILWTLYSSVLSVHPSDPHWPDRDRFVLSKGHAAPILYAALARKGFFPAETLKTLRRTGSMLQGHPDMRKTPGVEMSSGSLGMGISVGVGMALAARLSKRDYRTCVLVGDGELQEGQNWEGIATAVKYKLASLAIVADVNGVQLDGTTEQIMPMGDIAAKFRAFGLEVSECDGHDCSAVYSALAWAREATGGPRAIVAHTVKGKGVSFMENQSAWHGKPLSEAEYGEAVESLRG